MDTSDRINLIEALLTYITSPDGPEVERADMALDEFGFRDGPQSDFISNEEYFRARLRSGDDRSLIGLTEHFRLRTQFSEDDTSMWEEERFRLFLSFVSENASFAVSLKSALSYWGIDAFISHEDIEPDEEWQTVIESALSSCHALAALLTPSYHASDWTDQEVGWARGRGIPVISLRLGLDPYGFIGKRQAIRLNRNLLEDMHPNLVPSCKLIVDTLWKQESCLPFLQEAIVIALAESGSWDQTRMLLPYAERCEKPSDSVIERLEKAMDENNQIYEALASPISSNKSLLPRFEALVERWRPHQPSLQDWDDLPFE